jgi:uncharacterized membrane protein
MTRTIHAIARLQVRLTAEEQAGLARTADAVARAVPSGSAAIRLATIAPDRLVDPAGMLASADSAVTVSARQDIVAIVREGRVVTIMLRRHGQPFTAAALRVDRVAG